MTKYVDVSPFELLEGRLLPSDGQILAVGGFIALVAARREGANVFHVEQRWLVGAAYRVTWWAMGSRQ